MAEILVWYSLIFIGIQAAVWLPVLFWLVPRLGRDSPPVTPPPEPHTPDTLRALLGGPGDGTPPMRFNSEGGFREKRTTHPRGMEETERRNPEKKGS